MTDTASTDATPSPAFMIAEIATALATLGELYTMEQRTGVAAALLGKLSAEWTSNPAQAQADAESLVAQVGALLGSYPQNTILANAMDCAQALAGTWSGNDYV